MIEIRNKTMTILKKALLLAVLMVTSLSASAQIKIGYLNPQKVLDELPQTVTLRQSMEQFIQLKQQELIDLETRINDEYAAFLQNAINLEEVQLQTEQARLEGLRDELEQKQQSAEQEVQRKRAELLSPILEKMDVAVAAIAKEMNLDFVLNESTRNGDTILFFGQEDLNITTKVINMVKKP
jgi:outer membrane protein